MKNTIDQPTFEELADVGEKLERMANALDDDKFRPIYDPDTEYNQSVELVQAVRMDKKVKKEILDLTAPGRQEMKDLVKLYYQVQDQRIAIRSQIRAIEETGTEKKSNIVLLDWAMKNSAIMEKGINDALHIIADQFEVGRWLQQIKGVGPVIASGCLAYYDVIGRKYPSQFISYAGLNDNNRPFIGRKGADAIMAELLAKNNGIIDDDFVVQYATKTQWPYSYLLDKAFNAKTGKWSKTALCAAAAKIPYNRELKTLMWKFGQSVNWQCNNPKSLYGRLFSARRDLETYRNDHGRYADQAARILATKNIGKETTAYKEYAAGRLPKAHINARCQRWAEKIFICHLFEEMYRVEYNDRPARYYILAKDPLHNKEIPPEVPYFQVPDRSEPVIEIDMSVYQQEAGQTEAEIFEAENALMDVMASIIDDFS